MMAKSKEKNVCPACGDFMFDMVNKCHCGYDRYEAHYGKD